MKTRFLFPYWCKYLGVILFLAHLPVWMFRKQLNLNFSGSPADEGLLGSQHVFFVVTTLFMITGLVLFAFSKEKIEDEQIAQLRMDSLQWAVYLSYILLIIELSLTSGKADLKDITHMHVWVPLMLFIVIFRWKMFRNSQYSKEDSI